MAKQKVVALAQDTGETPDAYIKRLQDRDVEHQEKLKKSRSRFWWFIIPVFVLLFAIALIAGTKAYNRQGDLDLARASANAWETKAKALEAANSKLTTANSTLTSDLGVCNGKLSSAGSLSTAFAGMKEELAELKKQCTGKTAYLPAKPSAGTKHVGSTNKGSSTSTAGRAMDICIFRIHGMEIARTSVQDGAVNCPIWEKQQAAINRKKPEEKIWDKVYPTNKPL